MLSFLLFTFFMLLRHSNGANEPYLKWIEANKYWAVNFCWHNSSLSVFLPPLLLHWKQWRKRSSRMCRRKYNPIQYTLSPPAWKTCSYISEEVHVSLRGNVGFYDRMDARHWFSVDLNRPLFFFSFSFISFITSLHILVSSARMSTWALWARFIIQPLLTVVVSKVKWYAVIARDTRTEVQSYSEWLLSIAATEGIRAWWHVFEMIRYSLKWNQN